MNLMIPELEGEIHIWQCNLEQAFSEKILSYYATLLTEEEKVRWKRYKFEKDQHQFLITRALIKNVLCSYLNCRCEELKFEKNEYGKPFIHEEINPSNISINVSHTRGIILFAVTKNLNIGIDVERKARDLDFLSLAKRFFAKEEYDLISSQSEDNQKDVFFNIWTLKEAFIKAIGMGLSFPLDQFYFTQGLSKIDLNLKKNHESQQKTWSLKLFSPNESNHQAAICIKGNNIEAKIQSYRIKPFESITTIKHFLSDTLLARA